MSIGSASNRYALAPMRLAQIDRPDYPGWFRNTPDRSDYLHSSLDRLRNNSDHLAEECIDRIAERPDWSRSTVDKPDWSRSTLDISDWSRSTLGKPDWSRNRLDKPD